MKLRDVPDGRVFVYSSEIKDKDLNLLTFFSLAAPAYLKLKKSRILVSPNPSLTEPIAAFGTGKVLFANPDFEVLLVDQQSE